MTLLWISVLWVLASAAVAMLPMRRQYVPGVALLLSAPVLIVAIALHVGWFMALLAIAAFVSMYRNPLRYLIARLRGQSFEVPQ
ncbi:DUF2484 family protein [Sulfitobacter sp. PR48]|uniref:DUF2484 family protein n=1 Tax=Sulfitobacter sp. PR48 TaxID=3028383 RepID=UPI000DF384A2|nr:DUF2484 family protein [Sulfitobacter sp. PR48]MDD9721230.1 DUF2484 family protein [Sulfitobacter sp. PR48]